MKLVKELYAALFLIFLFGTYNFAYAIEDKNVTEIKKNIYLSGASIKPLADKLAKVPVIFIGENHTDYGNHLKQLEIINAYYANNKNISIAMEMFTEGSNPVLTEYINGKISESEFLKKSEYFSEWGFDFHYYKDIIDFAKKNKINLIGLSIKNEIIHKIGQNGFKNINEDELREIPDEIDYSMEEYKDSLHESFFQHSDFDNKQPDNFYLSQFIRDEYMARSAHEYLKKNPEKTLIILAGNGHIEFGYGIPRRLQRISGKDYKLILLDSPFKPGAADYFVFTQTATMKTSPRLKVILSTVKAKIGDKMIVSGFADAKIAETHVLKEKDEIIKLAEMPVHSISDIRLFLYDKSPGDIITISVIRDNQPLQLNYTLQGNSEEEFR